MTDNNPLEITGRQGSFKLSFSSTNFVKALKDSIWDIGDLKIGSLLKKFSGSVKVEKGEEELAGELVLLPLFEAMSNLIKEPFSRLGAVRSVVSSVGEQINKSYDVEFLNIMIVIAWTSIFIYGSYALLKKRDL